MKQRTAPQKAQPIKRACRKQLCACYDQKCENNCAKYRRIVDCKGLEPEKDGGDRP